MSTQNITYNLPDDVVEQLLCSHCNAYLSCAPIKIGSNGDTICGRCAPPDDEGSVHQVLFETTMAKFMFPCRYKPKGCKKQVLFNHAVEHEKECPYRTFCCPSLPHGSCAENLSVFDIHNHFNETHKNLILNGGKFKLEFGEDIQCNLLMVKDDVTVVIEYHYDAVKNILYLDTRRVAWDDNQVVHYKLQIINGEHPDNTVYSKEKICDRFESHTLNMQSATIMILDNYLSVLENPNFIYIKVNLIIKCKNSTNFEKETCSASNLSSANTNLQSSAPEDCEQRARTAWNSLEKNWCSNCNTFIIPPVYCNYNNICRCSDCKDYNYVISENKMKMSNVPCRWRGCSFIGNESNIEKHIKNCQFQTYMCPIGDTCAKNYYTAATLIDHMKQHATYCPNPKEINIDLFLTNFACYQIIKKYFTVFENKIVTFECHISGKYNWTLTGATSGLCTEIYFEHDHCRYTSKIFSNAESIQYKYSNSDQYLPSCFKTCKNITAVIKIVSKKK